MPRSAWMYTGEMREGLAYEARPGVENDRYARPDELVWRYMKKDRFLSLVRTRELFFARMNRLMDLDPYEGSIPVPVAAVREMAYRQRGIDMETFRVENERFHREMLQTVLVNCWHKREFESRPMWERYGKGEAAVAIVTTLDKLIDAVPDQVTVGHVEYVDLQKHQSFSFSLTARCFLKGRELEDEREVRAVIYDPPAVENGRWSISIPDDLKAGHGVEVRLEDLLGRIVISPASPQIIDEIKAEVDSAGIDAPVSHSELSRRPEY